MNGKVDDSGRALVTICVRALEDAKPTDLTAWIDTAFTGELVIPRAVIESLGLNQSATVAAKLADGSEVVLETFSCLLD